MVRIFTLSALFFFISFILTAQEWKSYPYEPANSVISFPIDEGIHIDEPQEWWYTSGYLVGENTGTRYSYVISYFYYPYQGFDGFRILNMVNEDTGQKYFDTKPLNYDVMLPNQLSIEASSLFLPKDEFWKTKKTSAGSLIPFEYELFAASSNIEVDLQYVTFKRPLILGGTGKFDQGESNYTYYYSQTGITVEGKIKFLNSIENVTGSAWIDRQYGSYNPFDSEKYEWFSIQLSNGMDLNLYNIFNKNNEVPDDLKYRLMSVYKDDTSQYSTKEFEIERLEYFYTEDQEKCYAKKFRLKSEQYGIDLIISSNFEDSEVELPFRFYEGSTSVTGTVNGTSVTGAGFAELLHTYESPVIELTNPIGSGYNSSDDITWNVLNPDEGNPLLFDLFYSIDNKATFIQIGEGITDTFFSWENPNISNGENIWFKLVAYSRDETLNTEFLSPMSSTFTLPVKEFDKQELSFYPNPSTDLLILNFPPDSEDLSIGIYDIRGKLLYLEEIGSIRTYEVNLNSFQSGIYLLRIKDRSRMFNGKLIIE